MRIDALQGPDFGRRSEVAAGQPLPVDVTPTVADVRRAAELIDRFLRDAGREFSFSVDQVTGVMVVSVRNPATGDLIRQVPSEEILRIARHLDYAHSALVSQQA